MSTRTRSTVNDVILWGALGCALVGTAHAEYSLATAAHFNEYVAAVVPGALDLYVISALRHRRDVLASVLVMVAANVASHLIAAGMLPVGWPVISAVGAVAPLIVWRVYVLRRVPGVLPQVSAPVPEDVPAFEYEPDLYPGAAWPLVPAPEYVDPGVISAPDHVPAWMPIAYPPLKSVPEVPEHGPEDVPEADPSDLSVTDMTYLGVFDAYLAECKDSGTRPTVAGTKAHCQVGQDRARRLLKYRGYPQ